MFELHHILISAVFAALGAATTHVFLTHHRGGGVSEREAFQMGRDSMLPFD